MTTTLKDGAVRAAFEQGIQYERGRNGALIGARIDELADAGLRPTWADLVALRRLVLEAGQ